MNNEVVKRIHLLFTLFAGVVTLANVFLTFFRGYSVSELIDSSVLMPLCVLTVLLVIYYFLNIQSNKFLVFVEYLHVGILFITASIAILDYYGSIYGIGFFFLGGYLALQYKLVGKRRTLAITVYFLIIISFVEFSALFTAEEDKRGVALDVMAFLAFFYLVIISLDRFRLKKILDRNKRLQEQRDDFRKKYRMVADLDNFIDLPSILSPRQFQVAELIYSRNATDKENAHQMGISINTYRNHLKDMRQILGVNTKLEILYKVRPYFIMKAEGVAEEEIGYGSYDILGDEEDF